jgi:hypothetical protein
MLRSNDINAPLPGTYDPSVPGSGVFPLGTPGPVFQMESAGLYNQNQLIANIKANLKSSLSLFGFYVLNSARSNTDGINTFPANPYVKTGEYGPASTDVRQRVSLGGSVNFRWNVRVSPFLIAQSGVPFDVTTGTDLYGTTIFNARPGIPTDLSKLGLISTSYGVFDPSPSSGEQIIHRNYGRGPAIINFNMRVAKTIGFGAEGKTGLSQGSAIAGGDAVGTANAASGKGLGSIIGVPKTAYRYNLTFSLSGRNIINHVNPGPVIGNITSTLFGKSNQIAGIPNGEGFYETASNRRIELQIRLTF